MIHVEVVQAAANTSGTPQIITVASGKPTDTLVQTYLAFMGYGITNGTAADHAALSVGFASWLNGTNQSVSNNLSEHNLSSRSDTYRNMETSEFVQTMGPTNGQVDGEANVAINGNILERPNFEINWGNFPAAANLMEFLLFSSQDLGELDADVGTGTHAGNEDTTQDFTDVGFEPDVVFFHTTTGGTGAPGDSRSSLSFGFATNEASIFQACHSTIGNDNVTTSLIYNKFSNNRCAISLSGSGIVSREVELTAFLSNGFELTKRASDTNLEFHYLAVKFNNVIPFTGSLISSPTSTGDDVQTWPGFKPQCIMLLTSFIPTASLNSVVSTGAGAFGISLIDENGEYSICYSDEDNASVTNTQSLVDDVAVQFARDNGNIEFTATGPSGNGSFDERGYTLDFTAANVGGTKQWAGLAFGTNAKYPLSRRQKPFAQPSLRAVYR